MKQNIHLINADVIDGLKSIEKNSVDTIITSPPYYNLRDYQVDGQIGLESTLEEFLERLLEVTKECKRVLKPTGVMFWNMGDSYGGNQGRGAGKGNEHGQMVSQKNTASKCMTMQNERLIIKMIDDQGWILRNRIIWNKPNGMPSSVTDRFSNKYEPVYMLTKQKSYWFDLDAVRVPHTSSPEANTKPSAVALDQDSINHRMRAGGHALGKNPGDVWNIPTQPHKDAHFAIMPEKLVEPLVTAGCPTKVCPVCGFIRERITEKFDFGTAESNTEFPDGNAKSLSQKRQAYRKAGFESPPAPKTIGWTSCSCDAGWNPGVVLDPFCGSGTTMVQAKKLGRSTTGIELSGEYCKIIKRNLLFHQQTLGNIENIFTKL